MGAPKEPGAEAFGRRIRARREELGLSRRDLVEASGLSYPYVSQLETGYRLPSHKALAALADALELSPTELSAAIPYEEALASSDLRGSRRPRPAGGQPAGARGARGARGSAGWHRNPDYVEAVAASGPPTSDLREVAREVADLLGALPPEERLDALGLVQRQVMEGLVAEQVRDRRRR